MWMEEPIEQRLNVRRVEQVMQAEVDVVATACPWCLAMFEDGIKAKEIEESVKAKDLSELVVETLSNGAQPGVSQKEDKED